MRDLSDFIDKFLSLPFDTRRDCISIAEKNFGDSSVFQAVQYNAYDVYNYISWRYTLPMNHRSSWHYLFDNNVAGTYESL